MRHPKASGWPEKVEPVSLAGVPATDGVFEGLLSIPARNRSTVSVFYTSLHLRVPNAGVVDQIPESAKHGLCPPPNVEVWV